ncbi:LysR family transcriptional regulator [Pendulispora rubella]|uniref:LysR family transcriptional regulator n=1 Tax=Pendulispora rubella TaxID=2741070 RepID=A0ABZ2LGC5_9BACT
MGYKSTVPPVSIDDLRVVVAVAEHGSFALAARHTGVPTSTVSRTVARFEEAAGVRLFQRNSRRVSLTPEGTVLLERAAPLLDEMDRVVEDLAGEELSGRLRVTAPTVSGSRPIAEALMSFAEAHPKVIVELSLTNAVVDLLEEGLDLAFRAGPVHGADLVARRIWAVPFGLGASPAFVQKELAHRKKLDRAALESLPAIVTGPGTVWRFRREDGAATTLRPHARFSVSDLRVGIEAATRGLGIVRAPRHELVAAGLLLLEPKADVGHPEARELYAVYPSRRLLPKRVALAIDWVARALRG